MRIWLTLLVLLCGVTLHAQNTSPVTFAWDLDPTHDDPDISWELDANGEVFPCVFVQAFPTYRQCQVQEMPISASSFRLRGVLHGVAGGWTPVLETAGAFRILAVRP